MTYFDMGGYAAYIWPSYAVTVLMLVAVVVVSLRAMRKSETDLKAIQSLNPRRARKAGAETGTETGGDAAAMETESK